MSLILVKISGKSNPNFNQAKIYSFRISKNSLSKKILDFYFQAYAMKHKVYSFQKYYLMFYLYPERTKFTHFKEIKDIYFLIFGSRTEILFKSE